MADVTYYVALPFLQDDSGSPFAGAAEECQSSSGALRRAEVLSRTAGSVASALPSAGPSCVTMNGASERGRYCAGT